MNEFLTKYWDFSQKGIDCFFLAYAISYIFYGLYSLAQIVKKGEKYKKIGRKIDYEINLFDFIKITVISLLSFPIICISIEYLISTNINNSLINIISGIVGIIGAIFAVKKIVN